MPAAVHAIGRTASRGHLADVLACAYAAQQPPLALQQLPGRNELAQRLTIFWLGLYLVVCTTPGGAAFCLSCADVASKQAAHAPGATAPTGESADATAGAPSPLKATGSGIAAPSQLAHHCDHEPTLEHTEQHCADVALGGAVANTLRARTKLAGRADRALSGDDGAAAAILAKAGGVLPLPSADEHRGTPGDAATGDATQRATAWAAIKADGGFLTSRQLT